MDVSFRGIKNEEAKLFLPNRCVIFTGSGSSGKTARMDAVRLALTGRASVGGSVSRLQSICNHGYSEVACGSWKALWEMGAGKRPSNTFTKNGEPCTSQDIIGVVPTTLSGFLELTSEQQWWLIEELCGKATDTGEIAARIKSLRVKLDAHGVAPAAYTGDPIEVLTEKFSSVQNKIDQQLNLSEEIKRHSAALNASDNAKADIQELRKSLEKAKEELEAERLKMSSLEAMAKLWQATDGAEPQCIRDARAQNKTRHEAILFVIDSVYTLALAGKKLASEGGMDEFRDRLSQLSESAEAVKGFVEQSPDFSDNLRPTIPEFKDFSPVIEKQFASRRISALGDRIAETERAIELSEKRLAEAPVVLVAEVEPLSDEQIIALTQERDRLRVRMSQATMWKNWIEGEESRQKEQASIKAEIEAAERELSEVRRVRNDRLAEILGKVRSKANAYLYGLGWEANLRVSTTAKTSSLVIENSDGIELVAMAGNEQAIYGLAVLCAIQDLSSAEFPVVFHECAEIEPYRLRAIAESVAVNRKKGCVFLSHWASPQCNASVTEIKVK